MSNDILLDIALAGSVVVVLAPFWMLAIWLGMKSYKAWRAIRRMDY
jgi:hypothetical protein